MLDPVPQSAESGGIQSVHRAMRLLSLFAPQGPDSSRRTRWSVSDLARTTGLHKSVVARLMATMAADGFVFQDPVSRTYSIGEIAFAVGSSYEPYQVLDQIAHPVMSALTAECGHASYLGVPAADHYVFLLACESTRSIRATIELGEQRPYHTGAIGKALLAGMSDDAIVARVGPDPLPQMTPYSIASLDQLMVQVTEIRHTGIARNQDEAILGTGSVAAGIRNAQGETVAGLGIVFPSHIVSAEEIERLAVVVLRAGQDIERQLAVGV
jgi:IclR family KDG regulon transcriptional repressor